VSATPRRPRTRSALVRATAGVHAAGGAVLLAAPGLWPWVAGVLIADHALLAAGSLWPRSTLVGPNLRRLRGGTERAGGVALTFDDGPDPRVTPRVLDLLDARGARGTFFCVGRRAETYPGLVAEIARRGHGVENHSYRHSNAFCFYGPRAAAADIDRAQAVLAAQAGSAPRWFRAPAGLRNPWLDTVLQSRGLALASWTRRGFDTVSRDAPAVARRLVRGLAAGDILMLHDGHPGGGGARTVVLDVLPPPGEAHAGA
jgi:peptidoglycan/xylan/chitin deacetylase (PgdA/CDA1 family)